ncbi:unnamed protein product [Bodo saltans]|uniref:Integrase SAM-like N-terminal domain-containing protein n=1 Tax=Bodo saltans TaxID=75058 RepID=A0A0S4ILN9_BODSA|nr:unnamed protein product [Bodo saltans]|eukprot:CUE71773.1 unnamed protein product [Bodo saltans]
MAKKTRVQKYIERSITNKTLEQYNGRIIQLQRFLTDNGEEALTTENFAAFLETLQARTRNTSRSTAEGYRAAILFHQRTYGLWTEDGIWADTWTCKKMIAGYSYAGKTQGRPRGQVTSEMFQQMIQYARTHHSPYAPALEIGYRIALHPHQIVQLKKGDFNGETLLVPDKRSRSSNTLPPFTRKAVLDENARWILQSLETVRTGRYFNFDERQLRTVFKMIASALGWNTLEQKYDGPHCLRHGGMAHVDNILAAAGADLQTRNRVLQVSETTRRRYTKPNDQRK